MTIAEVEYILVYVFILIFAILSGLVLAFFATQNTNGVTLTLLNIPLTDTPLWAVVVVSILIGLVCASFFNVVNIVKSAFKLHGKDATIKGADRRILDLKSEIQSLKAENANLKSEKDSS